MLTLNFKAAFHHLADKWIDLHHDEECPHQDEELHHHELELGDLAEAETDHHHDGIFHQEEVEVPGDQELDATGKYKIILLMLFFLQEQKFCHFNKFPC